MIVAAVSFFLATFSFFETLVNSVENASLVVDSAGFFQHIKGGFTRSCYEFHPQPFDGYWKTFERDQRQQTQRMLRCCPARTLL